MGRVVPRPRPREWETRSLLTLTRADTSQHGAGAGDGGEGGIALIRRGSGGRGSQTHTGGSFHCVSITHVVWGMDRAGAQTPGRCGASPYTGGHSDVGMRSRKLRKHPRAHGEGEMSWGGGGMSQVGACVWDGHCWSLRAEGPQRDRKVAVPGRAAAWDREPGRRPLRGHSLLQRPVCTGSQPRPAVARALRGMGIWGPPFSVSE